MKIKIPTKMKQDLFVKYYTSKFEYWSNLESMELRLTINPDAKLYAPEYKYHLELAKQGYVDLVDWKKSPADLCKFIALYGPETIVKSWMKNEHLSFSADHLEVFILANWISEVTWKDFNIIQSDYTFTARFCDHRAALYHYPDPYQHGYVAEDIRNTILRAAVIHLTCPHCNHDRWKQQD